MAIETDEKPKQDTEVSYNLAMRRVVYLVLIGCGVAIFYAFRFGSDGIASVFEAWTNAMMAGGAALVSGGLLGFLFGVPHTREEGAGRSGEKEPSEESNQPDRSKRTTQTKYRPNTSLEQISDWLSKMLVGVGLVEIKVIPEKLRGVAAYVANGLGNDESAKTFAMTELLYFSICGFVFGFLWARLYLPIWFRQVDEGQIQALGEKIDRLAAQQNTDAKALALIPYLNLETDDSGLTEAEVAARIKAASPSTRSLLFAQAQRVSEDSETDNYDMVIWIFQGLINSDTGKRYHRNHSELSYAFRRLKPPNWSEAEKSITRAIEIRDRLQLAGWKYYEFHRARCRIEQDPNFKKGVASDAGFATERILDDLREAYTNIDKWEKWNYEKSSVRKWMSLNQIEKAALQTRKATG